MIVHDRTRLIDRLTYPLCNAVAAFAAALLVPDAAAYVFFY
jgi:hypothetical protein|tara:strand:+ start:16 stop:138 length:123 start_codon:yes stop_codon:yes gene_type:complete